MKEQLLTHIFNYPVIPVFYHDDVQICKQIMKACYDGGIRTFEFVNRGTAAKSNFAELLVYRNTEFPDLKLGIGTILDAQTAEDFVALGTDFLVSPIFNSSIAEVANKHQLLWIPGCMTPSEIAQAQEADCTFIKLFPGETLGPSFLKSIKPLFPKLKFMPTGGVDMTEDNIRTWFKAGVSAVGLGSKLFSQSDVGYDYAQIQANCTKLLSWTK